MKNAVNSAGAKHELNTLIIRVANVPKKKVDPDLVSFNSCSALLKKKNPLPREKLCMDITIFTDILY